MRAAELAVGVAVVAIELRDGIAGCALGVKIALELLLPESDGVIEVLGFTSWLFDPALMSPVGVLADCVATFPEETASMLARAITARWPCA